MRGRGMFPDAARPVGGLRRSRSLARLRKETPVCSRHPVLNEYDSRIARCFGAADLGYWRRAAWVTGLALITGVVGGSTSTHCDTSSMETDYKFGTPEPEDREWSYGNVWATEGTTGGGSRLVIAPAHGQTELLAALLKNMTGPFWLLYVLVVPRGRGNQADTKVLNHYLRTRLERF